MKKALVPVLAILAIAAIVVCFVLNGQKNDVNKKLEEATAKLTDAESLKDAAEAAKAEAEAKIAELEAKVAELEEKTAAEASKSMTHDQFIQAELDSPVVVDTYVQATQSWWDGKITVYAQSQDGAYFIYNMACTEEDAAKLVPGAKIRVTGTKVEWSGEVEIGDATFEFVEGDSFVAEPEDVTALLGKDELAEHMNEKIAFKGLKVAPSKVEGKDEEFPFLYAWDGSGTRDDNGVGADLYFSVEINGATYSFTVESYLCNNETEVYKAVEGLKIGDTIDCEGFLYWYNGANPHITGVTVTQPAAAE